MKKKELQLQIEKPCLANWDAMKPNTLGRHCDHCAKQVYDATNLSPEEILAFYARNNGQACMRIRTDLINKPFIMQEPVWYQNLIQFPKRVAFILGLQFLFFQQIKAQVKGIVSSDKNRDGVLKRYFKSVSISGTVADSATQEPIPYVQVRVLQGNKVIGTTTCKFDGTYKIDLRDSVEPNAPASIEFMQTAFDTAIIKSFQFNKNKIVIDTVFLDQSFSMLKEIDIDAPKIEERDYNAYMTRRIGNSSYSVGLMSITQMEYKLSPAELSKLIPPIIDPSPRNTQNDLKPGATPFLQ